MISSDMIDTIIDRKTGAHEEYRVDVPEGESGPWKVERFEVTRDEAKLDAFKAVEHGHTRFVPPGEYTKLCDQGSPFNGVMGPVMSDTPDEISDHLPFIQSSSGHVLIAGLGLGVCVAGCLDREEVEHVTVVERSPNVIDLVADHYYERYGRDRLAIVEADIFEYEPDGRVTFDQTWLDIWPDLSEANLEQADQLRYRLEPWTSETPKVWAERTIREQMG